MVIAVDFDGTIVENNYPNIGAPKPSVINAIKAMQKEGHELILWTCRDGELLDQAIQFLEQQGLHFTKINQDSDYHLNMYEGRPRKIGADFYVDDRALSPDKFVELAGRVDSCCGSTV